MIVLIPSWYLFSRMQQQDEPGPEAGGKTRNPKQIRMSEIQIFKTVP
jgi:hypothetical protein